VRRYGGEVVFLAEGALGDDLAGLMVKTDISDLGGVVTLVVHTDDHTDTRGTFENLVVDYPSSWMLRVAMHAEDSSDKLQSTSITFSDNTPEISEDFVHDEFNRITQRDTTQDSIVIDSQTYGYDARHRLISVTFMDGSWEEHRYHAGTVLRRETERFNASGASVGVEKYHYADEVLLEHVNSDDIVTRFLKGAKGNIGKWIDFGGTSQGLLGFAHDLHGNTVGVVGPVEGDPLQIDRLSKKRFDSWGETLAEWTRSSSGALTQESSVNNITGPGYRGLWNDGQNGMVWMRHRLYDPKLGRFTQVDPARAGNNWFAYAGGDPVNRWDPSGLVWVWVEQSATINIPLLGEKTFTGGSWEWIPGPGEGDMPGQGPVGDNGHYQYYGMPTKTPSGYMDEFGQPVEVFTHINSTERLGPVENILANNRAYGGAVADYQAAGQAFHDYKQRPIWERWYNLQEGMQLNLEARATAERLGGIHAEAELTAAMEAANFAGARGWGAATEMGFAVGVNGFGLGSVHSAYSGDDFWGKELSPWQRVKAGVGGSFQFILSTAPIAGGAGSLVRSISGRALGRLQALGVRGSGGATHQGFSGGFPWYKAVDRATQWFRRGGVDRLIQRIRSKGVPVTRETTESFHSHGTLGIRPGATRLEVLEEFVHRLQRGRSQLAQATEDFASSGALNMNPFGVPNSTWITQSAKEIHAKAFLLRHSANLGLGWIDRWLLRRQLSRLGQFGKSLGY
jgi:RHS repeat-associated protein